MALPSLEHFSYKDYDNFYEPSDDTYLLLDALDADRRCLADTVQPSVCLEIGPGSGAITTALATLLAEERRFSLMLAVDINASAATATAATAAANCVTLPVEVVQGDLANALERGLSGCVDVLVFNPPYVPTPPEEVGTQDIAAAWAGGHRGREVIDRVLPQAAALLSKKGVFYLVVVQENGPQEIMSVMKGLGLVGQTACTRRAKNELLSVLKFTKAPP
eukprot:TRINITY_DN21402_c0_g1_i1.p1 TRINITY_DN21402_c0_g1~~TRINITY_DN21402_c0_g1_i1.p1  ORF type:complete len:230 (-),score=77.48 TRINITY_DN21402_c0_g1_i1:489-1148(-)